MDNLYDYGYFLKDIFMIGIIMIIRYRVIFMIMEYYGYFLGYYRDYNGL